MQQEDSYYYNERESPGLEARPLEPRPASESSKTRARTSPGGHPVTINNGKNQLIPTHSSRGRQTPHLRNPGDPILMHYFAPNYPELQWSKYCDCEQPCRCSASPTDSTEAQPQKEMPSQNDPTHAAKAARESPISRTSSRAGIVRKAQDAIQTSKEVIVSRFIREPPDDSDEDAMQSSRRGSRSLSKALQERKRSSQLNANTEKDFASPVKRPRTAESNLRSTAHLGRRPSNGSTASTALSPNLHARKISEREIYEDEELQNNTLAPMSLNSISEAQSMASTASNVSLPPVESMIGESTRSRSSTANGTALPPPPARFLLQQTSSSSLDGTPAPLNPAPTSSSRYPPYFANGQTLERRPPRSRQPPGLHKYGSSTTSIASVPSVPGLSATESTSPEGFTPSTMATPGSNNGHSPGRPPDVEVTPLAMPANYIQVTHPIAGFKCTVDGCNAAPFPTPYTLR